VPVSEPTSVGKPSFFFLNANIAMQVSGPSTYRFVERGTGENLRGSGVCCRIGIEHNPLDHDVSSICPEAS
jgi:hypothetical protein